MSRRNFALLLVIACLAGACTMPAPVTAPRQAPATLPALDLNGETAVPGPSTPPEAGSGRSATEAIPIPTFTPVVAGLGPEAAETSEPQPTFDLSTLTQPSEIPPGVVPATPPAGAPGSPGVIVNATTYRIQKGTPARIQNYIRPDAGCNYLGVGGQVFNRDGVAVTGLILEVSGKLNGQDTLKLGLSGAAAALGPGGYEIMIADKAIASQGTLEIQLFDVSGNPISEPFSFDTSSGCQENLVLINFVETPVIFPLYYPLILRNKTIDTYLPNVNR